MDRSLNVRALVGVATTGEAPDLFELPLRYRSTVSSNDQVHLRTTRADQSGTVGRVASRSA